MALTKDQIIEGIKEMNVLELSELVSELEEVFGVSAAAPVAMAAAPAAGGAAVTASPGSAGATRRSFAGAGGTAARTDGRPHAR